MKCYHCGNPTTYDDAEAIGFYRDADAGFLATPTQRYLCPACIEQRKTNPTIGQPKPIADFATRAANTSGESWIVLMIMGFFGGIFLIVMPIGMLLNATGHMDFEDSSPPIPTTTRNLDPDALYRSQFSSEEERLEFEAYIESKDALMRDAPVGQTRGGDTY